MSLWSRVANVWRTRRLSAEIDEELASHLEEAVRDGRDPAEARRAFGSPLRHREHIGGFVPAILRAIGGNQDQGCSTVVLLAAVK